MDRVSLRERLNNYVKSFIDSWRGSILFAIAVFGLGTLLIMENLDHTAKQMDTQNEMIDLFNFNQQLLYERDKLQQLNNKQGMQINQMNEFIRQMYKRLQLHENLPDLPGGQNSPNRSEANKIHYESI